MKVRMSCTVLVWLNWQTIRVPSCSRICTEVRGAPVSTSIAGAGAGWAAAALDDSGGGSAAVSAVSLMGAPSWRLCVRSQTMRWLKTNMSKWRRDKDDEAKLLRRLDKEAAESAGAEGDGSGVANDSAPSWTEVRLLLLNPTSGNCNADMSPLCLAATHASAETCRVLIECGAKASAKWEWEWECM